jgi:hypothetical protein
MNIEEIMAAASAGDSDKIYALIEEASPTDPPSHRHTAHYLHQQTLVAE